MRMAALIIVFNSTHQALKSEDRFKESGIPFEVVPLPERFAAGCGIAIEFSAADRQLVDAVISRYRIAVQGIYPAED